MLSSVTMRYMEDPDVKRWRLTVYTRTRCYGEADPRTIEAARELARARVTAAEAVVARWQAELDALTADAVAS